MNLPHCKYGCIPVYDNLKWHEFKTTREQREARLSQHSKCLFLTGLSGSGKSTIGDALENILSAKNYKCYVLDGDNIRIGINKDLGFSESDRTENLRRIGEIAKLFVDAGVIVICTFIAPSKSDRQMIRDIVGAEDFLEVYINASIETCAKRDPKGLYKKAYRGEIKNFTGVDAPYEKPESPFTIVDTENQTIEKCVATLTDALLSEINLRG